MGICFAGVVVLHLLYSVRMKAHAARIRTATRILAKCLSACCYSVSAKYNAGLGCCMLLHHTRHGASVTNHPLAPMVHELAASHPCRPLGTSSTGATVATDHAVSSPWDASSAPSSTHHACPDDGVGESTRS